MNNTSQPVIKGTSIDQVMEKNDWTSWINNHKGMVIAGVSALALAILVGGFIYQKNKDSKMEAAESLASFRKAFLDMPEPEIDQATGLPKQAEAKKLASNVVADFQEIAKKHQGVEGVTAVGLELSDLLTEEGRREEAFSVVKSLLDQGPSKSSLAYFMLTVRHSVLLEDLGRTDEAVVALESLLNFPLKIMQDKLYFDLGRLYLKQGDKEKARANFQYVLDKTESKSDFKKLANIELQKLK